MLQDSSDWLWKQWVEKGFGALQKKKNVVSNSSRCQLTSNAYLGLKNGFNLTDFFT